MSDFYNKYPYTDFHELNLDWVIERVKQLTEDWLTTQQEWNDTEEQWQELYNYVHDYFDNLDVSQEINDKIDAMVSDGTFLSIISSTVKAQTITTTTSWLADHITQPTTPVVDDSLTIGGAAADAEVTGDYVFDIDHSLRYFNCHNDFHFVDHYTADGSSNGITYSKVGPDGVHLQGTATGNVAYNFYSYSSDFPVGLTAGQKIYVILDDPNNSNLDLRINKFSPSTNIYQISPNEYTEVTIPADATGISFYVRIPSGSVVNTTVRFLLTTINATSNYDLTVKTYPMYDFYKRTKYTAVKNLFDRIGSSALSPTVSGISIRYSDYGNFTFSGTPSADPVYINLWQKNNELPSWWPAGTSRSVKFDCNASDGTYNMRVYYYKSDVPGNAILITTLSNGHAEQILLPEDAGGLAFVYVISSDDPVSGDAVVIVTDQIINEASISANIYQSIYKLGVIGDSYSSVRLYERNGDTTSHPYDSPFYSWFGFLQRRTSMSYVNLAGSGYECKDWIDGTESRPEKYTEACQDENLCQVYLVCMGLNDIARHDLTYIGTTDDINISDPDQNAESFIGYYAKIIQKMKAAQPTALFIAYTMPTASSSTGLARYEAYNDAIREIVDFFDYVYLADLYTDYYDLYHDTNSPLKNPNGAFISAGHYTAQVQPIIADIMSSELSKVMANNKAAFCNIDYTAGKKWAPT